MDCYATVDQVRTMMDVLAAPRSGLHLHSGSNYIILFDQNVSRSPFTCCSHLYLQAGIMQPVQLDFSKFLGVILCIYKTTPWHLPLGHQSLAAKQVVFFKENTWGRPVTQAHDAVGRCFESP